MLGWAKFFRNIWKASEVAAHTYFLYMLPVGAVVTALLVFLTETPVWLSLSTAVLVAAIAGVILHYIWAMRALGNKPRERAPDATLREIEDINDFLIGKDEIALRATFDFPNMLEYNIKRTMCVLDLGGSDDLAMHVDRYFLGGQGRLDTRYCLLKSVNNRAEYEAIPGMIGLFSTSLRYVEARAHLDRLASSALLPEIVSSELQKLSGLIEANSELLAESINNSLSKDPRFISENFTPESHFCGSASGAYWASFAHLRPAVDRIAIAIRSYLKD